MFVDIEKAHKFTKRISSREKENTITELVHWVKENLTQDNVKKFTKDNFDDLSVFLLTLSEVYKALGVEGVKGEYSDFLLFTAGASNKIYVSHLVEIAEDHKKVFADKLGMGLVELGPNLSKLDWRKNVSV